MERLFFARNRRACFALRRGSGRLAQPGEKKDAYIPNLSSYTGCRHVYNGHAVHGVYDPLGTDQPQPGWPHPKPTIDEIRKALH